MLPRQRGRDDQGDDVLRPRHQGRHRLRTRRGPPRHRCRSRAPVLLRFALGAAAALGLAAAPAGAQKAEGLALTPPMGWNSWNHYGCNIDETLIRQTADILVASGLRDAGYVYVNLDDCWHGDRDELGIIHPDPPRFPSGIYAHSDYMHVRRIPS